MAHLNKCIYQIEPIYEVAIKLPCSIWRANSMRKVLKLCRKFGKGTYVHFGLKNIKKISNDRPEGIIWTKKQWEYVGEKMSRIKKGD